MSAASPLLWRYTAAEVRRRPGRTLLTLLGIVIGVAATVAITVTVQTSRGTHRELFETMCGRAALEVVAAGESGFDPGLAHRLEAIPGIAAALPVIQQPAALLGKSGAVPVLVLGIDPTRDDAVRRYRLRRGRPLTESPGAWLEAGLAAGQGLEVGNPVRFLATTGMLELPVAGVLEPYGAATFNGGAVAFMPLAAAQRLFGLSERVTSIHVVLADGASVASVTAAVRQALPAGMTVQPPAARSSLVHDAMLSSEQGLATMSATALVAGAFVILNTFLMNLSERRRQLAILRALGATRRQVTLLLLREALLLGSAGTVLGIVLGMALSTGLRSAMGRLLNVTLPELHWTPEPFLLAVVLGPGMALAATYVPARRAGRRAVLHDLVARQAGAAEGLPRWLGYLGLVLLPLTIVLILGVPLGWYDNRVVVLFLGPLMAATLVSGVLILPLVIAPLTWLVEQVLRRLLGRQGALAVRQLDRYRLRTTLTAGVLCVALIYGVGFGQSIRNSMAHVRTWIEHIIYADFYVRGSWPDMSMSINTVALPEAYADELAGLEGVEHVGKFRYVLARAEDQPVVVLAWTMRPDRPLPLYLAAGERDTVARDLARGEAVLGTALAQRLGRGVGADFTLDTPHGPQRLRVAGTVSEYSAGGMAVYLDWDTAKRCFNLEGVHTFLITARPASAGHVAPALQAFCQRHSLLLQSSADVRRMFDRQLEGFLGVMQVLMVLVFVLAALGIANTLTMNVLEQTRELGILRAIGMRRKQLGLLMVAQALALALISLIPGVCLGLGLAYMINLTTYPLVGQHVPFHVDGAHVLGCCAAAVAITIVAALIPARRAARVPMVQALQYD